MTHESQEDLERVTARLRALEKAEAARRARARLAARSLGILAVAGALALPALATALDDVPNGFSDGDVVSASEMNDNFQHLVDGVTALQAATNYVTGEPCGATAATNGDLNGYDGAKSDCETACAGDTTAHVCTSAEMLRFASEGNALTTESWISQGTFGHLSGSGAADDCAGFTTNGTQLGTTWLPENRVQPRFCSDSHPVACCASP